MKGLPVQVSFVRDAQGVVSSLVHHQNGAETTAVRVARELVEKAESELERRIREKIAAPGSEAVIRRVIAEHMRGEPDYVGMSPALAAVAREQAELVKAELAQVGALKDVVFRGVGRSGMDVFDVRFENASMEWGFILGADGNLSGLYLRRSP